MIREKANRKKRDLLLKRKKRVRGKIFGTEEKPRLSVFKSNKYIYAQAINDEQGVTICAADSRKLNTSVSKESAKQVGDTMAQKLKDAKISSVVFDKNGYKYHGVVASLADALRDNGIQL